MNPYIRNIAVIIFIVISFLLFNNYWIGHDFYLMQAFFILIGVYAIILNIRAWQSVRKDTF
ncbi:hypothetical protein [Texcoconibacillus texcoconensis]|uniref:Uncharacterized protein n=1 Tax=Texcoconibacillus texcoconensis TaxID=1095777 RepID=A0A840QKR1_9BACI|nr:hypothetical protein [Texcoconibacillus texcoconensis]MBB5171973.1 hypothetical protein [Texcoconibacillus texcoconensis]